MEFGDRNKKLGARELKSNDKPQRSRNKVLTWETVETVLKDVLWGACWLGGPCTSPLQVSQSPFH